MSLGGKRFGLFGDNRSGELMGGRKEKGKKVNFCCKESGANGE